MTPERFGDPVKQEQQSLNRAFLGLLPIIPYLVIACLVLWQQCPIDDAFISFRYATNLASGHGPVFNPGGLPVEGYSSLAWVALLAPASLAGFDLPLVAKSLGLIFGALTLLAVAKLASLPLASRLVASILLAFHPAFVYHSMNGLETSLMTFLVACLAGVALSPVRSRGMTALVAAILVLTRPEGILILLIWSALLLFVERGRGAEAAVVAVVSGGIASLLQLAFRLFYYGDWIANSSRAKMLPLGLALPHGVRDVAGFLTTGGSLGALPALGMAGLALAWIIRSEYGATAFRNLVWLSGFWLLSLALLSVGGGDSFPLWRFYVPVLPLLVLSAAEGLRVCCTRIPLMAGRRAALTLAAIGLVAGLW